MTAAPEALRLDGVTKSYPHPAGEVRVLSGASAVIRQGERVAVLGPSGSGKSTLLALLAGLDRPSQGRVVAFGEDLTGYSEERLTAWRAAKIGIVFQQFHLMAHLTALENVALPLRILGKASAFADAEQALTEVGLGARLGHFPHQLSGGECQRVAIARALAPRPRLLLADEPSGNLDTKTGEGVMRLLFDLAQKNGTTLILVTHNTELAGWCDRRLVLGGGMLTDG